MRFQKYHLQRFIVLLFLICNTVFVVQSSSSFRTYYEPRTFTDVLQFLSGHSFYVRGKTLNYDANLSKSFEKIHDMTTPATAPSVQSATSRRWQVGRVSRKQYEIVNMLWRRTNVFVDEYNTSPSPTSQLQTKYRELRRIDTICEMCREASKLQPNSHNVLTTPRPIVQSTTPSFIEFYYLVEMENETVPNTVETLPISNKYKNVASPSGLTKINSKITMHRVPFFTFNNFVPMFEAHALNTSQVHYKKNEISHLKKSRGISTTFTTGNKASACKEETCAYRKDTTAYHSINEQKPHTLSTSPTNAPTTSPVSSKSNDKIKFFEVYDDKTEGALIQDENVDPDIENDIIHDKKIELFHIKELGNQSSLKIKIIKKHDEATQAYNNFEELISKSRETNQVNPVSTIDATQNLVHDNVTHNDHDMTTTSKHFNATRQWEILFNSSRAASWLQYPFAAVYVYERFQVHCDAGVISPHWVLASASCLSRHREDPLGDSRTAFVTYCGETWWNPERINYVKYSLIHPRFSSRDRDRRHLYNVGLIQVVTSMASACNNWAPVSLISHQFVADQEGSVASAIGWGLDRYDTRYTSGELPRKPLSIYDGMVFSNTCPGNIGYRRAKHRNEEGIKNVYCLSLPPYAGEEDDPTHGGLLLVGGKLIALYLQEERRQWGDQSAQYTGIWRLVPWIMEVAREPDEIDFSMI